MQQLRNLFFLLFLFANVANAQEKLPPEVFIRAGANFSLLQSIDDTVKFVNIQTIFQQKIIEDSFCLVAYDSVIIDCIHKDSLQGKQVEISAIKIGADSINITAAIAGEQATVSVRGSASQRSNYFFDGAKVAPQYAGKQGVARETADINNSLLPIDDKIFLKGKVRFHASTVVSPQELDSTTIIHAGIRTNLSPFSPEKEYLYFILDAPLAFELTSGLASDYSSIGVTYITKGDPATVDFNNVAIKVENTPLFSGIPTYLLTKDSNGILSVIPLDSITIQGPKGDKGDIGATGLTGEKGDKGDIGATGLTGEKGDKGDIGAMGLTGAKGDKGDIGATGLTGEKGDKGEIGAMGLTGEKGDKGEIGATGLTGAKGDIGATGLTGEKGDKGDIGATGLTGKDGQTDVEVLIPKPLQSIIYSDTTKSYLFSYSNAFTVTPSFNTKADSTGAICFPNEDFCFDFSIATPGNTVGVGLSCVDDDSINYIIELHRDSATGFESVSIVESGETINNPNDSAGYWFREWSETDMWRVERIDNIVYYRRNDTLIRTSFQILAKILDTIPLQEYVEQYAKGDKGDKGDIGATGLTGEKGDKGDIGATGLTGAKGDKGDIGATGLTGAKGDKGDIGATGLTGAKGDKGDIGATGLTGAKGDKGDIGATGLTGEKGDKGDIGATGLTGKDGQTDVEVLIPKPLQSIIYSDTTKSYLFSYSNAFTVTPSFNTKADSTGVICFPNEDFCFDFSIATSGNTVGVGLSCVDEDSINYIIELHRDSATGFESVSIVESGETINNPNDSAGYWFREWSETDMWRVERIDNIVYYRRNDTLIRTSFQILAKILDTIPLQEYVEQYAKGDKGEKGDPGDVSNVAFNGNRQILRVPTGGTNMETNTIAEWIEWWYIPPFVKPTISISQSPTTALVEVGTSTNYSISGNVTNSSVATLNSGNLTYFNAGFGDNTSYGHSYTFAPQTVQTISYRAQQNYISQDEKDTGTAYSATKTIRATFPVFWGLSEVDYSNSSTIPYNAFTKSIRSEANFQPTFSGSGFIYILIPKSWTDYNLSGIVDHNGFNITPSFSAFDVSITSIGLINNWTQAYRMYKLKTVTIASGEKFTINR